MIAHKKYLLDISLDGNNGEGDDGFEEYKKCLEEVARIDAILEARKRKG